MQITNRYLLLFLDEKPHSFQEIIAYCQGCLPPEQLYRAYTRENGQNLDDVALQTRLGLQVSLEISLLGLISKQHMKVDEQKRYLLTEKGFEYYVSNVNNLGKILKQLRNLLLSKRYNVSLTPREKQDA